MLVVVFREVGALKRQAPGAFRGWLRTILVYRVRDYFRKRKYTPTATGDSGFQQRLDELQSPASELSRLWDRDHDEHVTAVLLRRVEGDFAPVTWQAFRRYVLEGQPVARVAAGLGLSQNSVLVAKSRVLKRLREELSGLLG